MNSTEQTAFARLQGMAQRGAECFDPVRFRFLQAMARRADNYDGEARLVLDAKLKNHLDIFEQSLARHESEVSEQAEASSVQQCPSAALAALITSMSEQAATQDEARALTGLASRTTYPELGMLDAAQATWLKVSTDRQLRDSEQRVPDNAGPLNSSHLVHRALLLMKELSPDYLRQFLSYTNALAWLEQMSDGNAPVSDVARAGGARKPARNRRR